MHGENIQNVKLKVPKTKKEILRMVDRTKAADIGNETIYRCRVALERVPKCHSRPAVCSFAIFEIAIVAMTKARSDVWSSLTL